MDTFLSRMKSTVRSVGRNGAVNAKGKQSGQSGRKASGKGTGKSTGRGGKSGKTDGRSQASGAATSRPAARPTSGTKSGAKPRARAGAGPKGRSKSASGPRNRTAKSAGKRGGSRSAAAKKPADDGKQDAGSETAGARRGPSTPVRVLAMLLAFGAMVAFAGVLSRLTLEPSAASESIAHTNLQPGASIRAYLSQPAFQDTVKQLGGNIVLGLPFGVLLPVLIPRARGFVRVTAATALVMLLVELVQGALINGRAFDIDDVILNSTGAFIGYLLLGRWLGRAVHPPRRRWWQRWIRGPVAD